VGRPVKLSECLSKVNTRAGLARVQAQLARRPFPHFETATSRAGLIVKIDEDGKRTVGRFANRRFCAVGRK
jgi:hypothetical protein